MLEKENFEKNHEEVTVTFSNDVLMITKNGTEKNCNQRHRFHTQNKSRGVCMREKKRMKYEGRTA